MSIERGGVNYQDVAVGTTNIVTKQSRFYGFTLQGDGTNAGTIVVNDGIAGAVMSRGAVSATLLSYAFSAIPPVIMTSAVESDPGTSAGKQGGTLQVVVAGGATKATVFFQ